MYPVRDTNTGLWGYWVSGKWAIEPQFTCAFTFHNGYAAVDLEGDAYDLITTKGTRLGLPIMCSNYQLCDGFTFTGFSDLNSNSAKCATICVNKKKHRQWGLIDTALRYKPLPIMFAKATNVQYFNDHLVLIDFNKSMDVTNFGLFSLRDMKLKLPMAYSCIYPTNDSIWVVSRHVRSSTERSFAFYDVELNRLISDWYWGARPFSEGFGIVNADGESPWYYVDANLRPVFDRGFDGAHQFSHGLAAVSDGDDSGYIDTSGQMRLLLPYDELHPFNCFGWALANRNQSEWDIDIIDRTGKAHVTRLETAVFWNGDYPYFEVTHANTEGDLEMLLLDMELNTVFTSPAERHW
jgi:hypothetical protein